MATSSPPQSAPHLGHAASPGSPPASGPGLINSAAPRLRLDGLQSTSGAGAARQNDNPGGSSGPARPSDPDGSGSNAPAVQNRSYGSNSSDVALAAGSAFVTGASAGDTQNFPSDELPAEPIPLPPPLARLPVGLSVAVPVREFRVRHLLAISAGNLIETQWGHGEDLPLASGDVQLAWSEFEVIDSRLAVRVTRLA